MGFAQNLISQLDGFRIGNLERLTTHSAAWRHHMPRRPGYEMLTGRGIDLGDRTVYSILGTASLKGIVESGEVDVEICHAATLSCAAFRRATFL